MNDDLKLTPDQARQLLWNDGVLHWTLRPVQNDLYNSYKNCKDKIVVWNCSRRLGKSYTLCVISIEHCLQNPKAIIYYCCAKQKDAKNIIRPLIRDIIETCPLELRPEYKTQEVAWIFPNGARIQLFGLDGGKADSIRGGASNLCIIDEAGLVDDLPYIITSIILPTTSTTKGKIILASTPPRSPSHPFITRYLNKAKLEGNLITRTIFDNPNIDKNELDKLIEESGGINSTDFQREYMCVVKTDSNYAIVPEFTKELQDNIVREWPKAPFYDVYVSMDVGMKDLTVVLFGWYDFSAGKLIIEDEYVTNGQQFNTLTLAEGIKAKEAEHFTDKYTGEQRIPYMRISDNNLIVIKDLWDLHLLHFIPTKKDDKNSAINKMRIALQQENIIINPRCKILIHHLEAGIWNKQKTDFARSADNGHFDAIDSLVYLVRNVQENKNPYPANYRHTQDTFINNKTVPNKAEWNKIFNINQKQSQTNEMAKIFNLSAKKVTKR